MEIKTNHIRRAKGIYSEFAIVRKLATTTCVLAESQRKAEEWESFIVIKCEDFRYTLIRRYWHVEAIGEQIRNKASYVTG